MLVEDHLRPAAVNAGVLIEDDPRRFGFHNQSWIERFDNITDRHYVVNVMGSYKPATVREGFRGLEGLLKQQASAERIGAACRQIVLKASEHTPSIAI